MIQSFYVSEVIVLFDIHPHDPGNLFEQAFILLRKSRGIVAVDVDLADDLSMGVRSERQSPILLIEHDRYRGSELTSSTITVSPEATAAPQMP